MRTRWLAALVVGVAVALTVVIARFAVPQADGRTVVMDSSVLPPDFPPERLGIGPLAPVEDDSNGVVASPPAAPARTALEVRVLGGRVIDTAGAPVRGAVVSWTPVPAALLDEAIARTDIAGAVERTSVIVATRADGTFSFASAPEKLPEQSSVLWITSEAHRSLAVELPPDSTEWPAAGEWVLEDTIGTDARVVDSNGAPIAGATVVQEGLALEWGGLASRLAWLLRREAVTGEDGIARLAPTDGRHRVVAHADGRVSLPWVGALEPQLVLTIRPTFQAAGRLTWSPELSESTVVQVSCSAVVGPHARELTRTRVRADRWGPQTIDLSGAPEYRFRLDGDGVITEERVVPAPDDGALVTVDFDVRPGHILWFRILDEAGQAVPEAEASVRWQDRGIEVSRRAVARDDGLIPVWGCPSGIVVPTFRAPGFIQVEGAPIELPFVEEGVIPVTLLRAGALRGVVVCGGKPVRDFQVVVWPERDPGRALRFTFDDTADGRFALSEIPHGDLTITATAAGFSQGVPRNVRVEPGREAEVRIEVLPVLEAIGRVVDATTGASIPGATVRVEASDGFRAIGAAGPPRRVTLDGAFRVEGVSVGRAFIEVSAPGFSSTHLSADAVAETPVDFGVVRLEPRQELVIHLRHEPSDDPTAYQVRIESPDGTSMAPFGPDAFIRVPEASAGDHRFVAFHPDGSWKVVDRHLSVGSDWYVELDASGGATLRVSALDPSGILPDEGAWVETKRMTPSGPEYRSANLDARKRVVIRHLASGHHEVVLHGHPDLGSVLLASTSVDLDDRADVEVELVVGDRDRRFRVVDDRGVPVDGVSLSIDLHDRGGSHSARGLTDSDGSCVVPSLVAGEVLVHLGHPTRGYQLGIPVRIAPPGEPTPVVFEDPVRTEVVLMRRTGPVVGAVGSLCDRQLLRAIEGPPSDELGRCVWTNVAPGEYVFAFEEEGYWPTFMPITVADGVAPVRVDLYRLCDVRVSVTRGGLPVSGAEVSMQRIGGTTPLADFVAQRLVESSTGSMRTDSEGTLRLSGVAEWEYAWNVSVPTGESREGFVEVTPVGEVLLDVEL